MERDARIVSPGVSIDVVAIAAAVSRRLGLHRDDVEDFCQDAQLFWMAKGAALLASFRGECAVETFAYSVIRSYARRWRRLCRSKLEYDSDLVARLTGLIPGSECADDELTNLERARQRRRVLVQLRDARRRLSAADRLALRLRFDAGFAIREVAEAMNTTIAAASTRISRALSKLRRELTPRAQRESRKSGT